MLVIVFYEEAEGGLRRRVNQEAFGNHPELMTRAELAQTMGLLNRPEHLERVAATTELLLEAHLYGPGSQDVSLRCEI